MAKKDRVEAITRQGHDTELRRSNSIGFDGELEKLPFFLFTQHVRLD